MPDLIIPCFNPPLGWASKLVENTAKLVQLLPEADIHLILVNDGSTHGVQPADIRLLHENLPHFKYITYAVNQGKGHAIRIGAKQSRQLVCLYTDIDFPYQETCIASVYHALADDKADIVSGYRKDAYYAQVPNMRSLISKSLKVLSKNLLHLPINDTQCGLKGFNRFGLAAILDTNINRYLFDLEFIYLASTKYSHLRLLPLQVELKPGVFFSRMNARVLLQEGYSFLKIYFASVSNKKYKFIQSK